MYRCRPRRAVEPVADSAISVVIEAVHARIFEAAVGLLAVPAFPDGCRAHLHRVEPGRIGLLQQ